MLVGQNVEFVEKDGTITITIDATKNLGLSASGKNVAIANSGGFKTLPNGMKLNLWLGKPNN